jgi:F0F1-type ATP synthase assembly protein I
MIILLLPGMNASVDILLRRIKKFLQSSSKKIAVKEEGKGWEN